MKIPNETPEERENRVAWAANRYIELLDAQKAERKANPKLAQIGPDGFCPVTAITRELEEMWALADMGKHL